MSTLTRLAVALCTAGLAGLTAPAAVVAQSLTVRDPQVCCARTDAAGKQYFFKAPRSQCRRPLQIAGNAKCAPNPQGRICCETRRGVALVPAGSCNKPAHPDRCKQIQVCCKTHHGLVFLPAAQCGPPNPSASPLDRHEVPMQQCTKPVCCKIQGAYKMAATADCHWGVGIPVSATYCHARPGQRVCCRMAYPGAPISYAFSDRRKCTPPHGRVVSNRYCLRLRPSPLRKRGG